MDYGLSERSEAGSRHVNENGIIRTYKSYCSENLNTGVPQGSNLGPVLFLLYINDLPNDITEGDICLFADDVCHLVVDQDAQNLLRRTQEGINKVTEWCDCNKIQLNQNKTTLIQFYNRKTPDFSPNLKIINQTLNVNNNAKYLGLTLSSDLKWNIHINNIASRLAVVCCLIRRLQNVVDKEVLLKVYFGCFHSLMTYGILFWGNSPDAERIFILQKRIVRIINKEHYLAHCKPIFKALNILTLSSQFILEAALLVKKNPDIFTRNSEIHSHNTRQSRQVHKPRVNTTLAQRGPLFASIEVYNNIPQHIQSIQDLDKFKKALKKYLTQEAKYTIKE